MDTDTQHAVTEKNSEKNTQRILIWRVVGISAVVLMVISFLFLDAMRAPAGFPLSENVLIEEGSSLQKIGDQLAREQVVRFAWLFQVVVHVFFDDGDIRAGAYKFETPTSTFGIARSLANGENGADLQRITIHEGLRVEQIDILLADALPHIQPGDFTAIGATKEGYFFPDTYFIPETYRADDVAVLLEDAFSEQIRPYLSEIQASGYTVNEIITMASIIEREANNRESMRTVSGILWRRINIDMPLQVDAPFGYLLGKTSAQLTLEDLQIDSPFNTYVYRGLPPRPIASPGINAIEAALRPSETPYLYYLTDMNGEFRYAETFEEHRTNKVRYLQ